MVCQKIVVEILIHFKKLTLNLILRSTTDKKKGPPKNKTPACLEISSGGEIKTLHKIFETSVGDNTKLANNFESSSNEREKTS